MAFTPLGNTLNDILKQIESSEVIETAKKVLDDFFGEKLIDAVKPLFLKNRTLTVSCTSGAVAQEIRLNQIDIVEKINEKLGKKEIDRIRYLA